MMTYDYDAENAVIHLKASGMLTVNDPIEYFQQLDQDATFKPKAEERIYFLNLNDVNFTFTDAMKIRKAFAEFGHGDKISKGVFIVDSDLTYAMARMVISVLEPIFNAFKVERVE